METALAVRQLSVTYGGIDAISDISIDIKKGEFLGITGPNGGGKTTLLSAVLGLIKPISGDITILGGDINKGRRLIGYVPQIAAIDRDFPITVSETVMTAYLKNGLHPFKKFGADEKQRALETLKKVGLENHAKNRINELSGGEFQRLLIARALATEPEILLLDEPTSNIDKDSREKIYRLLKELNLKGVTVVMVTHDLQSISALFSRLLCINRTVVFDGAPSDFLGGNRCD